ncbi:hypothetical protein FKO59_26030 [Burkholderia pseudomallei]|uniref:hypothetical protein n=1 Tax=Burkholderia pseudomallei TaxID=28450 RepID=UPI0011426C49|nr:hypothetical protein [Burkholderia pseudomallei]QDH30852.1 hypothetical protein FKO42_26055 [Burkholderia pseudomallei]QDH41116.1 hypothetical protein FKO59_26030 [Burkholderia pseudomallei]
MPARKTRRFDPQFDSPPDHYAPMPRLSKLHGLWAATFVIAVASDVLSGAIRYYTSLAGVAALGYLPKALMVACLGLAIVQRPKASHVLVAAYLAAQTCVSLANGVSLSAVGFWIWTIAPMLFAIAMPPQALDALESPRMLGAFVALALLCIGGVLLNYFVKLPWVGGSVDIGGVSVQLAKSSYVGTSSRLPGFGRSSATTGLMIGLLTTWIFPRLRSRLALAALLALAAAGIWATTNKTTLVALALVVALHCLLRTPSLRTVCIWTSAVMIALPIAGWIVTLASTQDVGSSGSLSSMQDRFINTWPLLIEGLLREHLIWFGIGPGGFGSAVGYYTADFGFNVGYADNMALYTVANFGLIGAALIVAAFARLILALPANDRPVWLMLCFLLVSGVTTDICETIGCLLFLGLTLRSINLHAPRRARVGSARIAFERLRYGAGVIAPNAR